MRLLVVEDEVKLAQYLHKGLTENGHIVDIAHDGVEGRHLATGGEYDLVLLDVMLPGLDGLSLCRELRQRTGVPIVMLTALADEADRLAGLELGADDYIPKTPFSPREVMARIKAVLRRSRAARRPPAPVPALQIDAQAWRATWQGQPLDLTPIEFRLLHTLTTQPGRVYPRAQLLELLHGDAHAATERAVDSHVKNLRRKLDQAGAGGERIHSVYGVGYRYDG